MSESNMADDVEEKPIESGNETARSQGNEKKKKKKRKDKKKKEEDDKTASPENDVEAVAEQPQDDEKDKKKGNKKDKKKKKQDEAMSPDGDGQTNEAEGESEEGQKREEKVKKKRKGEEAPTSMEDRLNGVEPETPRSESGENDKKKEKKKKKKEEKTQKKEDHLITTKEETNNEVNGVTEQSKLDIREEKQTDHDTDKRTGTKHEERSEKEKGKLQNEKKEENKKKDRKKNKKKEETATEESKNNDLNNQEVRSEYRKDNIEDKEKKKNVEKLKQKKEKNGKSPEEISTKGSTTLVLSEENYQNILLLAETFARVTTITRQQNIKITKMNDILLTVEQTLNRLDITRNTYQFIWKINDFKHHFLAARNGEKLCISSPEIETHHYGYKLGFTLCLNGDGVGLNTHMSMFFRILKGKYDDLLPWPFDCSLRFSLMDQKRPGINKPRDNIVGIFTPSHSQTNEPFLGKPTSARNKGLGLPRFAKLDRVFEREDKYILDDTIFIKIEVDLNGLETRMDDIVRIST
ncbi:hypothetical protein LSH36_289g03019 [Paralvinella palmiformis]|uniref:MATH domain-containing protein n=1 Tax=Paralvinella palmiformis TaxID=53620 RepID=A0AAD9N1H8_9ANNE|nr:hypothetical protein LSH36_289g03019 [Paralvinella palmiformis]